MPIAAVVNISTPEATPLSDSVTLQSDSGYFKKKTFYPRYDAPNRRIEILRPWGTPPGPGVTGDPGAVEATANATNCDATVIDHTTLPHGWVRVWTHSLNGVRVEKTITASSAVNETFPTGGIPQQPVTTETQVRYIGQSTVPMTSVHRVFQTGADARLFGRSLSMVKTDGSTENSTYHFGTWNPASRNFAEDGGGDLKVNRVRQSGGRTEQESTVEDYQGHVLSRTVYRSVGASASLLVSRDVHEYDELGHLIRSERQTDSGWRTTYLTTWTGEYQTSETDSTGVVTAFADTDGDGTSDVETRAALPSSGGLPAIPERTVTRSWDNTHVWQTESITSAGLPVASREWKLDGAGRVLEEKRNDFLITRYEYETGENGSQTVRRFERAVYPPTAAERLISATETDGLGRVVSLSGPGVVEEHHTYVVQADGNTLETITRGSSTVASEQVITERLTDPAGRRVGEKVNVPNGVWRTWEYDGYGRVAAEKLNGTLVRSYAYDDSMASVTETAQPGTDPARITARSGRIEGNYEVQRIATGTSFQERWTKLGLLGSNELGETKIGHPGLVWVSTKTSLIPGDQALVEEEYRAGATSPDIRKSRAGVVVQETHSADGSVVTRVPNALGRPTMETVMPVDRTTYFGYDYGTGTLNWSSTFDQGIPKFTSTQALVGADDYAAGRVKSQTENGLTTYYRYTARGALYATWGASYPVRYTYDGAGRLVKMETYGGVNDNNTKDPALFNPDSNPSAWPDGDKTEWKYFDGTMALQKKLDASVPVGKGAGYTYDPRGPLATRTWARGVVSTYTHNALGELKAIVYSGGPPGAPYTPNVSITRDATGRITQILDGSVRTFEYDDKGRLMEERGSTATLTRGYDTAGRETTMGLWGEPNGTGSGAWATWQGTDFDPTTGAVKGLTTPEGRMEMSYTSGTRLASGWTLHGAQMTRVSDKFGRVESVTTSPSAGAPVARTYGYDQNNRRDHLEDETGRYWKYSYDLRSQVVKGEKKLGGVDLPGLKREYEYDAIGNRVKLTVNGIDNKWFVTGLNQFEKRNVEGKQYLTGTANAAAAVSAVVEGNVGASVDIARGPAGTVAAGDFRVRIDTTIGSQAKNLKITVREAAIPPATVPTEQPPGHIFIPASPELFTYDDDGNLTKDGRWIYTWDAENRLKMMTTREDLGTMSPDPLPLVKLTFEYDANWRRTTKTVQTKVGNVWQFTRQIRFLYDRWNLLAEYERTSPAGNATFTLVRTHNWGPDLSGTAQGAGGVGGLIITRQHRVPNGTGGYNVQSFLPAFDGNGNVVALLDVYSGERVAEYDYGPFGETLRKTGPRAQGSPFRFSTKYCDEETGLSYYGYRYYSPALGRWANRDPIEESGGLGIHGFSQNNPVNKIDSLGLEVLPPVVSPPIVSPVTPTGPIAPPIPKVVPLLFLIDVAWDVWTHQDEIQRFYEGVIEKCCTNQRGRNERGQGNYVLDDAKWEHRNNPEKSICDILAGWMEDEKKKGRNADSCYMQEIKKAQKAAGCVHSNK